MQEQMESLSPSEFQRGLDDPKLEDKMVLEEEDEEMEMDESSEEPSGKGKRSKKQNKFKPLNRGEIQKLSNAEINKKLSELAKEIKVFKAQNRYLTKRCLHLTSVLRQLKENKTLIP